MSNGQNLKTVAANAVGQPGRRFDSTEAAPGYGVIGAAAVKFVLALVLVKKLLWGQSEAVEAPAAASDDESAPLRPHSDEAVETPAADDGAATAARRDQPAIEAPVAKRHMTVDAAEAVGMPDEAPAHHSPFGRMQPIASNDNHSPAPAAAHVEGAHAALRSDMDGSTGAAVMPQKADASDDKPSDPATTRRENRAPVVSGRVTLADLQMNHAVLIGLTDLLQNASDPDGDTLTISDLAASSGTLVALGDGTWSFTPEWGDSSEVTFSYQITDGTASVAQSALVDLLPAAAGDNSYVGTEAADTLYGSDGNDVIEGLGGDDVLFGAGGADIISGSDGDDIIYGGAGDDLINGGNGNDIIFAGDGNDQVFGGADDDIVFGGNGDDLLLGETGADVLLGENGNDVLDGGSGTNVLIGGAGDDRAIGGSGSDTFIATIADGNDAYSGGGGVDTLDLSQTTAGATVDLAAGTSTSAETGVDTVVEIENVVGSSGNDQVTGNDADNVITGGAGDDVVMAGGGNDTVVATVADGNDAYSGGDGVDTLDLSRTTAGATVDLAAGTSTSAETGVDTITDIENVVGSSGDDVVIASADRNVMTGGDGNDTFVFTDVDMSPATNERWDQITDFCHGDRIDVSSIDADDSEDGHQHFALHIEGVTIDAQSHRGWIRFRFEQEDDGEHTIVRGYVDDDDIADLLIDLIGRHDLTDVDFVFDWHS